jgi:hypothetical protein
MSATNSMGNTFRDVGSEVAGSRGTGALARAGLVARGLNYLLIGVLAIQIGVGASGQEADRQGVLHAVADKPGGEVVLWAIAVGFAGLTLWRLVEAVYGQAGPDGRKATKRLASAARAVLYGVVCASVVAFLTGRSTSHSSDQQSKDFTARLMDRTGGRWLVLLIGAAVVVAGVVVVANALRRRFTRKLKMSQMSEPTRKVVETFGVAGRSVRGVILCAVGAFLISAAASYDAAKAKGLDDTLRETATSPLGPWPLFLIAAALMAFGVYSVFEARYREVHPRRRN